MACSPPSPAARAAVGYALEGAVFNGGSTVQWLRDELKVINDSFDSEYFATKVRTATASTWYRPSPDSARPIGTPMRAAQCSA